MPGRTLTRLLCLAATSSLLLAAGCAGNRYDRSTGQYMDDKAITGRVTSALENNSQYKFEDVNVMTYLGNVQLSGFVTTADQKSKAGDLAKQVPGVKAVENNITLKDKPERTAGEMVDDKSLTARVDTTLKDNSEYRFERVTVATYHGIVQLSGYVGTTEQKSRAVELAKDVNGVKDVVNNITVKERM
jgi:hyperosmotically inducible protein